MALIHGAAGSGRAAVAGALADVQFAGQHPGERLQLGRLERQPVVGDHAGVAGAAFDGVEPVHRRGAVADSAARREIADVLELAAAAGKKIGVQRHDHVGLGEVVANVQRLLEDDAGGFLVRVQPGRLVLDPAGLRQRVHESAELCGQRRRGDGLGEDAHALAALLHQLAEVQPQRLLGVFPADDLPLPSRRLRAIRVVQPQHRRLREQVGGAAADRVAGFAFDLGGPALVALDEQADGRAGQVHGGRVVLCDAGDQLFRHADVGDNLLPRRVHSAACQAGQPQRRPQQRQETPPRHRVEPRLGLVGVVAAHHPPELFRVQPLLQAAPEAPAVRRRRVHAPPHRWHVEQSISFFVG